MQNETPFDKAQKRCSSFAWNLLSSVQIFCVHDKLDLDILEDQKSFELLVDNHCKYLKDEVEH